jgi:hypothetical protein
MAGSSQVEPGHDELPNRHHGFLVLGLTRESRSPGQMFSPVMTFLGA